MQSKHIANFLLTLIEKRKSILKRIQTNKSVSVAELRFNGNSPSGRARLGSQLYSYGPSTSCKLTNEMNRAMGQSKEF